jgi:sarcosine oxidase subunit alpha
MKRRLAPQPGEWIDRTCPITFRFEGQEYQGFAGDVLSSALWANDVRMLGRSFKYHRPRGIYSLANHDVNVMFEDGRRTNLRGDVLPIEVGLDVRAVNTLGGLAGDRWRITERFSHFLPVGFYYKAFYTPRWLFPLYESMMRKVAGLGRNCTDHRSPPSPKGYAFCDLLVVGAGPAGLAAAIAAGELGVHVMVVDEQPRPGGSLLWQWARDAVGRTSKSVPPASRTDLEVRPTVARGIAALDELLGPARAVKNIEIRCATHAGGCYDDHWIALFDDRRLTKLRAKALLVATGCFEQPAVFGNNDLPGVMLGSAAQRLIHQYAVKPFDQAIVLAANAQAYRVALDLHEAGVEVGAIVDLRPQGESSQLAEPVAALGIRVLAGHTVYEAMPASKKTRIRGAVLCPLDDQGVPQTQSPMYIACDGIVMSVGWAPNGGLLYQAGGRFRYAHEVEQFVPHDLPPGVFAAGRVSGVFELAEQIADGRRAGLAAARYLGKYTGPVPAAVPHSGAPPSHPYPIFSHKKKKNFVDLDEDLHLADFQNAYQEGYDNIELLKRYTTFGMGPSQGKLGNMNAIRILAKLNGASIDDTGTPTSRPFYQPAPIGHLAGRRFHPLRRTPLHHWHVQAEAQLTHAGVWLRPEYYRVDGKTRDDCIFDEALNVWQNVGLMDVGTLGKIEVNGPDAARFLEHIYTGRFTQQAVGRARYALACDETGVIIEDGVVARLAEDRFYVTATNSGAAVFYQEMQRWAILFQMNVALANETGQLAAMNVAGPQARQVLRSLTDLDLSPESFPFLGVRRGLVAGVRAIVMRVGFVGELAYEIHVPASHGLHVWTALWDAGQGFGVRPFGLEAQRLLRLEKGHLIVGQDTDALTNPLEAGVAWAIGKKKPFFVGSRSLEILSGRPLARRLVGLAFSKDYRGPLPEECNLILHGGEIAGRITSIARRTTIGRPIALALVKPAVAEIGTTVSIKLSQGTFANAQVVPTPFYDPENNRQ